MAETLVCSKCGKTKRETEFFKLKTGDRCDICKPCLTMYIDNRDPQTFLWILEKFDVPYIEDVWVGMCNKIFMKNPAKFGPMSVIGQYIRSMNMTQYKDYTYADTATFAEKNKLAKQQQEAVRQQNFSEETEEELKRQLEAGEISESEYNTLSLTTPSSTLTSPQDSFVPSLSVDQDAEIAKQLTDEDVQYLALKWGTLYKPAEWLKMEELYNRYAAENELNTDREDTLKKICKTSLKMDQALDIGDMSGYKSLSQVYDQLRKSAKFTEVQNKEEYHRSIDSIGELVAFVEQEGGAIPLYNDPIEYPEDKVDFTIKDIQNYVNRLVRDELGLGDLIESFIEKADKQHAATVDDIISGALQQEQEEQEGTGYLTPEEELSFQDFYMEEILKESQKLAESAMGEG